MYGRRGKISDISGAGSTHTGGHQPPGYTSHPLTSTQPTLQATELSLYYKYELRICQVSTGSSEGLTNGMVSLPPPLPLFTLT